MDAVEFLNEYSRLCDYYTPHDCQKCPLFETKNCSIIEGEPEFELIVSITEQWSKEHPRKTRAQDFFEKHPNARPFYDGNPKPCAAYCGYCTDCSADDNDYEKRDCYSCWNQPIE